MQVVSPVTGQDLWMTPGGGMETGESDQQSLEREVWEETGLRLTEPGRLVWIRNFSFQLNNGVFKQFEKFFLVFTPQFKPTMQNNPAQDELDIFKRYKWWNIDQLIGAADTFAPAHLGPHLVTLMKDTPQRPLDISTPENN